MDKYVPSGRLSSWRGIQKPGALIGAEVYVLVVIISWNKGMGVLGGEGIFTSLHKQENPNQKDRQTC
jgi:hypothetical protein